MTTEPPEQITRLVGVYGADGTLRGEVAYWIGARLGRTHCSLCEITHGSVRVRPEWTACAQTLPVPFDTYHRDDQPAEVRVAAAGSAPIVVADTAGGIVVLLRPAEIDHCAGSVDSLMSAIDAAVESAGLRFR